MCNCGTCTWCKEVLPKVLEHGDVWTQIRPWHLARVEREKERLAAQVTELQARGTELLLENRELKAKLAKHRALTLDLLSWFSSTLETLK